MTEPNYWFPPPDLPPPADQTKLSFGGDQVAPGVYVFDRQQIITRAINVAGATGRPLLIDGPSGCGKSSLAHHIAWAMRWDLQSLPITSRTQATDLLYTVDQIQRVHDAQVKRLAGIERYIRPGVLWRGFDPDAANHKRGSSSTWVKEGGGSHLPTPGHGAVILLDEIDKAEPDVPNNLLVPLGAYRFEVPELDAEVSAQRIPFIVLTTNNERKLPPAFLRRCVHLTLPAPDRGRLIETGKAHQMGPQRTLKAIADLFLPASSTPHLQAAVSIAEYLDAVRACTELSIDPTAANWQWLHSIIMGSDQQGISA
jgi:MoxR-like ATPase